MDGRCIYTDHAPLKDHVNGHYFGNMEVWFMWICGRSHVRCADMYFFPGIESLEMTCHATVCVFAIGESANDEGRLRE